MSEAVSVLRDVLSAVRITSPTSFSWLGSPSFRIPARQARALPPDVAAAHLRFALADQLYRDFFAPDASSRPTGGRPSTPGPGTHGRSRGRWRKPRRPGSFADPGGPSTRSAGIASSSPATG